MNDLIFIYKSKFLKGGAVPAWKLVSRARSAFFSLYIFIQIQIFKISLQDPGTFIVLSDNFCCTCI